MILITMANTIVTELSKIIAVDSEILRFDDGVVVGDDEGVCEVEDSTKFAGSINGARGLWLKLKEFIMSLAFTSLVPNEGRLKMPSDSLSIEPNSYCVWST